MLHAASDLAYYLDKQDRIIRVNDQWQQSCEDSLTSHLRAEKIVGRTIWDFIQDHEVRRLYAKCFKKVRRTRESITIPSRCDTPQLINRISISIHYIDSDSIAVISRVVHQNPRNLTGRFLFGGDRKQTSHLMCSICNRIHMREGKWLEVEQMLGRLNLQSDPDRTVFLPALCLDCKAYLVNMAADRDHDSVTA